MAIAIPRSARLTRIAKGVVLQGNKASWKLAGLAPKSEFRGCAHFVKEHPGSLQAAWTATGSLAAAVDAECQTRVVGITAILLEEVDLSEPVRIGSEVADRIEGLNQGSAADSNIRIVAALAESQEFVSAAEAIPVHSEGRTIAMWPLPPRAFRAEAFRNGVVKVLAPDEERSRTDLLINQLAV